MSVLCTSPINIEQELSALHKRIGNAGGVVSFTGHVRTDYDGTDKVLSLTLQAHPVLTVHGIAEMTEEVHARWPLTASLIKHRVGDMTPGDTIVLVAAAARHRRDAFQAADFMMDYLKTKAIFWKKETRSSGSVWIEPRTEDHRDAARWVPTEAP